MLVLYRTVLYSEVFLTFCPPHGCQREGQNSRNNSQCNVVQDNTTFNCDLNNKHKVNKTKLHIMRSEVRCYGRAELTCDVNITSQPSPLRVRLTVDQMQADMFGHDGRLSAFSLCEAGICPTLGQWLHHHHHHHQCHRDHTLQSHHHHHFTPWWQIRGGSGSSHTSECQTPLNLSAVLTAAVSLYKVKFDSLNQYSD